MAPRVPRGMALAGSRSEEARLAPERMPVKQGKKMARQSVNSYPGAKEGPQLARRFAVERPEGAGPVALAGASIGSRFGAPKRER